MTPVTLTLLPVTQLNLGLREGCHYVKPLLVVTHGSRATFGAMSQLAALLVTGFPRRHCLDNVFGPLQESLYCSAMLYHLVQQLQ